MRRKRVQVHCGLVPPVQTVFKKKRRREKDRWRGKGRRERKKDEKPEPVKGTSCVQDRLHELASPFCIQHHLLCFFFNNTCVFRIISRAISYLSEVQLQSSKTFNTGLLLGILLNYSVDYILRRKLKCVIH